MTRHERDRHTERKRFENHTRIDPCHFRTKQFSQPPFVPFVPLSTPPHPPTSTSSSNPSLFRHQRQYESNRGRVVLRVFYFFLVVVSLPLSTMSKSVVSGTILHGGSCILPGWNLIKEKERELFISCGSIKSKSRWGWLMVIKKMPGPDGPPTIFRSVEVVRSLFLSLRWHPRDKSSFELDDSWSLPIATCNFLTKSAFFLFFFIFLFYFIFIFIFFIFILKKARFVLNMVRKRVILIITASSLSKWCLSKLSVKTFRPPCSSDPCRPISQLEFGEAGTIIRPQSTREPTGAESLAVLFSGRSWESQKTVPGTALQSRHFTCGVCILNEQELQI